MYLHSSSSTKHRCFSFERGIQFPLHLSLPPLLPIVNFFRAVSSWDASRGHRAEIRRSRQGRKEMKAGSQADAVYFKPCRSQCNLRQGKARRSTKELPVVQAPGGSVSQGAHRALEWMKKISLL